MDESFSKPLKGKNRRSHSKIRNVRFQKRIFSGLLLSILPTQKGASAFVAFRSTTPLTTTTPKPCTSALYSLSGKSSSSRRRRSGETGSTPPPTGNMATYQVNRRAQQKLNGQNAVNGTNNDDDDDEEEECKMNTSHKAQERQPPFPASAYTLAEEEEKLKFHYVSFIDQSILKTYSQQTRLIEPRGYAIADQFRKANANTMPTIDDVAMPATKYGPIAWFFAWNGLPARAVVGSASYLAFPLVLDFLQTVDQGVDSTELSKLVDSFLPGVAIVLGTYFSLTISILYDRLARLQEAVNAEASVLALTLVNLLHLFEETDPEAAVEGSQCIADQVRTMVLDSRGRETMGVIYSDPYARILRLLKEHNNRDGCQDAYLLADLHGNLAKLFELRSDRLTVESLALAPVHFDVMTFLSGLLLVGFVLGTVATAADGAPSETARVLFAALVVCYTIFYEMAWDLNRPFDGIYQLRRSGAAMHMLQIKQILTTHPVTAGRVDFEEIVDDTTTVDDCDGACQERKARIWYN